MHRKVGHEELYTQTCYEIGLHILLPKAEMINGYFCHLIISINYLKIISK